MTDHPTADSYFAIIPEWVLDRASSHGVKVYGLLARYADKRDQTAYPKHKTLAERAGLSVSTIRRTIAELEDLGALIVQRRFDDTGSPTSNEYTLVRIDPLFIRDQRGMSTQKQTLPSPVDNKPESKNQSHSEPESLSTPPSAMDELVQIFGQPQPAQGGTWARYQKIANLAKGHPPGEVTRRAENHAAGFDFALTIGSLEKRWDELGGKAAAMNTLTLAERKTALARARERAQLREALG